MFLVFIAVLFVLVFFFIFAYCKKNKQVTDTDRLDPELSFTLMKNEVSYDTNTTWVGSVMDKQLVVFDKTIQPRDTKFIYIYYVNGNSLCTRFAEEERQRFKTVKDQDRIAFALKNYNCWKNNNAQEIEYRKGLTDFLIETPRAARAKCTKCNGNPKSIYSVGSFSEGSQSDGFNIIDICDNCSGAGYIDILACNVYSKA